MPKVALDHLLSKGRLVPCQAITNYALAGAALPSRIKLLNWGENPRVDGPPLVVGDRTLTSLPENQNALGFDRIALDYNHQSLEGHPNFKPDPREHAAFGTVEVIDRDGVYLSSLAWTPSGEKNARNYADLSPTPLLDPETNEVLFMHSVALCTQGKVKGLSFFSASFLGPQSLTQKTQSTAMNPDLKKLLVAIFGCSDDADDTELLESGKAYARKILGDDDTSDALAPLGVSGGRKPLLPMSESVKDICQKMGLSEATWRKWN